MLKPARLGLSGGIIWGLCMFGCTILAMYTGYSKALLKVMMSIYPGYTLSWGGAIAGLFYGFADAFIGLWLLAWLYNRFCGKTCGCKSCGCRTPK